MKAIIAAASSLTALLSAGNAAIFTENFDTQNIGRSWGVYNTFGQFVTTSGAGIEIQRSGTVVSAHTGNQLAELDSHNNSAFAALLNLQVGEQYQVSFAYRPRTNTPDDNGVAVSIGTLTGNNFVSSQLLGTADGLRQDQNAWRTVSYIFTALAGHNALQFGGVGISNSLGGLIDSVLVEAMPDDLQATPVPGAFVLALPGFAAMALRRRQQNRSRATQES